MISTDALARLSLFRDVGTGVVPALARRAVELRFDKDDVIFKAGHASRGWFVVIEGQVRVVQGTGARQHVVHTEGPGGTLGEIPFFLGGPHPATGIAATATRCALFDRSSLQAAIAECPEIAFVMTRCLALRTRALVERLNERSALSVRARLIDFIIQRAETSGRPTFSVGMTQQALAEELGTVREVIGREFRRLTQDKVIVSLGGGRYRVPQMNALRRARELG